jgi:hypothetical protein
VNLPQQNTLTVYRKRLYHDKTWIPGLFSNYNIQLAKMIRLIGKMRPYNSQGELPIGQAGGYAKCVMCSTAVLSTHFLTKLDIVAFNNDLLDHNTHNVPLTVGLDR